MANVGAVYVPNAAGWAHVTQSKEGPVGRELLKRGEKLRVYAVKQVGKGKTGSLARSIHVSLREGPTGLYARVGSSNRVALIHHQGTRPHVILPEHGQLLRFPMHGRIVYLKKIMHPGTKPNRYLFDNLRRVAR